MDPTEVRKQKDNTGEVCEELTLQQIKKLKLFVSVHMLF